VIEEVGKREAELRRLATNIGIESLSTCARQEAENHGIVDLSALDDIEVDIRVLLAVHECTMERRSALAREEPLALGDIRDIADQERPARRKQFDRGINELENARLDEDDLKNAVDNDGVRTAQVFVPRAGWDPGSDRAPF
jgi:hypothetical protein